LTEETLVGVGAIGPERLEGGWVAGTAYLTFEPANFVGLVLLVATSSLDFRNE